LARLGLAAVFVVVACGKKSSAPPPEVVGLAAVPASAEVVIVADVARVVGSPLVQRAVDQLLVRQADLAAQWEKLHDACKIDFGTQIKHVVLAVGPKSGTQPGSGPVLMVATGKLTEADFSACVRAMVGQGGGSLTAKVVGGRTLYQAKEGNRTMFFAFGRSDTVVLGSNEAFVTEALGNGKKVIDSPEMRKWIDLADQKAPLWGAGRVDERVKQGLVRVTSGQISSGPVAMVVAMDPTNGAQIEVDAIMASPADAKALESFAKQNLALLAMAAQAKGMAKVVDHIAISSEAAILRMKASLSIDDVNQLVSGLDGTPSREQDSPPAAGSGGSSGP
jgi:hypothetical protein